MRCLLISFTLLTFLSSISAASIAKRYIPGLYSYTDDTNGLIAYSGSWHHQNTSLPLAYRGTLSYTNDPNAYYQFSVQEDDFIFGIYSGRKLDRGWFYVAVDGESIGTGDQYDPTQSDDSPTVELFAASVSGPGPHTVLVSNGFDERLGKVPYLALDFVELTDGE